MLETSGIDLHGLGSLLTLSETTERHPMNIDQLEEGIRVFPIDGGFSMEVLRIDHVQGVIKTSDGRIRECNEFCADFELASSTPRPANGPEIGGTRDRSQP